MNTFGEFLPKVGDFIQTNKRFIGLFSIFWGWQFVVFWSGPVFALTI